MHKTIIILGCVLICFSSCYSFKGGSIPPEVKSVNIQNFGNVSENGNTALSQAITDILKDKFLSETRLVFEYNADWNFEGNVTAYRLSNTTPSGTETAAQSRLTITVKVKFSDKLTPENNWQQDFSAFADYENTQVLADVEEDLLKIINNQIVVDIFNKATANW